MSSRAGGLYGGIQFSSSTNVTPSVQVPVAAPTPEVSIQPPSFQPPPSANLPVQSTKNEPAPAQPPQGAAGKPLAGISIFFYLPRALGELAY